MFLLSPLPRHFCLYLILRFLLPLFLLSSLRVLSPVFSLAFVFLDVACLFCSWLGLSSSGFSVSLLPAVLCLALHYCLLPLFALLLLAPLRVSKALPLRCLDLLGLFVSMQFAPGSSRVFSGFFSYSFLRCSSCLRCGSLWLCLSAVQALLGFLFPCSLLQGFSAASSLPPVASAAGLSAFPQLRLAPSLISLALLLCLAVLRLMLRCLGLLRLLPSSSLSVWLGSSCPLVGVCGSGRYRCYGSGS